MSPVIVLLALDLALTVLAGAGWIAAAVLTAAAAPTRGRTIAAALCAGGAVLTTAARVPVVWTAAGAGWWFVGERVLLALPLAVAGCAVALVGGGRTVLAGLRGRPAGAARRRELAAPALLTGAAGSLAGVPAVVVVGYPVDGGAALVLVLLAAGAAALCWAVLGARASARAVRSIAVGCVLVLVSGVGWAWARDLGAGSGAISTAAGQTAPAGQTAHAGHVGHAASAAEPAPAARRSAAPELTAVSELRTPPDAGPDAARRRFTIEARTETVRLPSGTAVDAWTFGGLPGPELRITEGEVVEVDLVNVDVESGVTLHWHGYDVPNGEDGVAGVTQDAVPPGGRFTYRFVADQVGTYWYHTHQTSRDGVVRGLYGTFVVLPRDATSAPDVDLTLPVHTIAGRTLLGAADVIVARPVAPGSLVRLRLVNTDQEPRRLAVTGARVRVVAVDGADLVGPQDVDDAVLRVPAGGRYDVELTMPDGVVDLAVEGAPGTGLRLHPPGTPPPEGDLAFPGGTELDLFAYGTPDPAAPAPGAEPARDVVLVLDRQLRFVHGLPAYAWTVNGQVWPHVPAVEVATGEVLRLTVVNRSTETHPMHPHGHDVEVISRDGVPPAGSPLTLDTFDVRPGELWQVLLRADNPGLWMSHCHNLDHAALGMVLHLAYAGVTTEFHLGGAGHNTPE